MRVLNLYIIKQLLIGIILVTLSLLMIVWLSQSLRFIEFIMSKGLSIFLFVKLTMLLLPNFFIVILPIALFSVALFTYNRMITDRELVVLRAAGLSNWQISKPALIVGALFTVVSWFLTLYLVPLSVMKFREMKWTISHDVTHLLFQEGEFTHLGKGLTVFVRERTDEGALSGIMVYDERKEDKAVKIIAEKGMLVHTENGPRVIMVNGTRHEIKRKTKQFSLLYFDQYTMDFGRISNKDGVRFRDARERGLVNLLTQKKTPNLKKVDIRRFRVEAHKRIINPLFNFIFILIAVTGLLIGGFDRRGQTKTVMFTIAAMVVSQASALGLENLSTSNLHFIPLMYLNMLLPIGACIYLLNWYNPSRKMMKKSEQMIMQNGSGLS
jgi:lipopolysaccharide export system permease protein